MEVRFECHWRCHCYLIDSFTSGDSCSLMIVSFFIIISQVSEGNVKSLLVKLPNDPVGVLSQYFFRPRISD